LAQQQALQKKHNEGRLMILGGYPGTTYFNLVHDMAAAVTGESGDLRLIALDAHGGIESLRDLLLLRGVDLAVVPENVLDYANAVVIFGPGLRERLTYVTQVYGEEVHFLVGPGADSFENLRGKKVAVPEDGVHCPRFACGSTGPARANGLGAKAVRPVLASQQPSRVAATLARKTKTIVRRIS
jgi:hypothetical protein